MNRNSLLLSLPGMLILALALVVTACASGSPAPAASPLAAATAFPVASLLPATTATPEPARAVLRWTCVSPEMQGSPANPAIDPPNVCMALPACYFASSCQLPDMAWIAPSKLTRSQRAAACADVAPAHGKTVAACLAALPKWDYTRGWGIDGYVYADPDAPLYTAP